MTRRHLTLSLLPMLAALSGCEMMGPQAARQDPVHFTMGVEQDGQRIPVTGQTVRIRRAPFRLVFYFEQMGSMLVHASRTPETMQQLQRGASINTLFPPGASIVEELNNPQQALYLTDTGYHNWLYLGPKVHRFDPGAVHQVGTRGFICRRTIAKVIDTEGTGRSVPLEDLQADRLYLSFVQAERTPGSSGHSELQRDWLIVEFVD